MFRNCGSGRVILVLSRSGRHGLALMCILVRAAWSLDREAARAEALVGKTRPMVDYAAMPREFGRMP
jgi:hypothetical protein